MPAIAPAARRLTKPLPVNGFSGALAGTSGIDDAAPLGTKSAAVILEAARARVCRSSFFAFFLLT